MKNENKELISVCVCVCVQWACVTTSADLCFTMLLCEERQVKSYTYSKVEPERYKSKNTLGERQIMPKGTKDRRRKRKAKWRQGGIVEHGF